MAIADTTTPATPPEHPFEWYRPDDLDDLEMFDDVRAIVRAVVAELDARNTAGALSGTAPAR